METVTRYSESCKPLTLLNEIYHARALILCIQFYSWKMYAGYQPPSDTILSSSPLNYNEDHGQIVCIDGFINHLLKALVNIVFDRLKKS